MMWLTVRGGRSSVRVVVARSAAVDRFPAPSPSRARKPRLAKWISGLEFTEADRKLMLKDVIEDVENYAKIRTVAIDNSVAPALRFEAQPSTGEQRSWPRGTVERSDGACGKKKPAGVDCPPPDNL